jgi:aminomethyltransferase
MTAERTALYDRHRALGGKLVDFAGWELPQQYSTIRDEHLAVRSSAGLFDLSHMGRVDVHGGNSEGFLQRITTNDVARLEPAQAQYTLMCDETGGVIDDLVIYRHDAARFTLVVNASNREQDLEWMHAQAPDEVEIADRTHEVSLLALQGPKAEATLPSGIDVAAIPYFGFARGEVAGCPATISRTGYTGEDGFEIFVDSQDAARVWDGILEAGEGAGVKACGLGARDVCRLEAGLRLYGNDMDRNINPYEAGLGWTVKPAKAGEFIGKRRLKEVKEAGPKRRLVGLKCLDRSIPRHDSAVKVAGRLVGRVTSGTYSFWLNHGIAMALVEPDMTQPGLEVEFDVRGQAGRAQVTELPFYKGSVRSMAISTKS